jgi:photosystem II stability/assembly factor-like uncharacterized protein
MNNGLRKNNSPTFEWNEVRVGVASPGPDWVEGNSRNLYFKNSRSIEQISTWATRASGTTTNLRGVAFGNGVWVLVGDAGVLRTSTDTITWVTQNSQFGTSGIESVAFGNGLFVAVGIGGTLRTSTNGVAWVTQTSQFGASTIRGLAFANSLWIAGGVGGTLRTSTNGVSWATQTSQFGSTTIRAVAFGNGVFFAVGDGGTIRRSTDGVNWSFPRYTSVVPSLPSPPGHRAWVKL